MEKLTTNDGGFNDSQSGTADGDGSAVVFWKSVAKYDLYLEFQVWISDRQFLAQFSLFSMGSFGNHWISAVKHT